MTKYLATFTMLIATVSLWVVSFVGGFTWLDNLLYDGFVRTSPKERIAPSDVLLVEIVNDDFKITGDPWLELLHRLIELGSRKIVFSTVPTGASDEFFLEAERSGRVVFGRRLFQDSETPGQLHLEEFSASERYPELSWGIVAVPPADYGIHRTQHATFNVDGNVIPSLEIVVTREIVANPLLLPGSEYLVNFNGRIKRLPHVKMSRVLAGELVPEAVQGHIVLIGNAGNSTLPGIHTPVTTSELSMSLLEYQGYSLNTLLSRQVRAPSGLLIDALVILVVLLLGLILYQSIDPRGTVILFFIVTGFMLFGAWVLLSFLGIWLPVTEALLCNTFVFLYLFSRRYFEDASITRLALFQSSSRINQKLIPEEAHMTEDRWSPIVMMVNNMLDLRRTIFLERLEGDHRLREIKAVNCSLDDIVESRRDYEREPYLTAITTGTPMNLSDYGPYLQEISEEEIQYLVALRFGNRVLGFWALGISPERVTSDSQFESLIQSFAGQFSELLHRRSLSTRRQRPWILLAQRYLRLDGASNLQEYLSTTLALMEQRLALMDQVFNNLGAATLVYDLFGRPIHINNRMSDLLKKYDILPYDSDAVDLVAALTNMKATDIRKCIRGVVIDGERFNYPVESPSTSDDVYLLHMRPVIREDDDFAESERAPFQIFGIMVELYDATEFKRQLQVKEKIIANINYRLRNDLQALTMAFSLIQETTDAAEIERLGQILSEKSGEVSTFLDEAQEILSKDILGDRVNCYPVDARDVILSITEAQQKRRSEQSVEVDLRMPYLPSLVWAQLEELRGMVTVIIETLSDDATEDGRINITWKELGEYSVFEFDNKGFGLPNAVLQEYLLMNTPSNSRVFKSLNTVVRQAENWGGTLEAESALGIGLKFTLKLKRFI